MTYELTGLWQKSLGLKSEEQAQNKALEMLRSSFDEFRKRVAVLVEKVADDFPDLTVHDVTHLDALWETADLIAGPDYPLNPLEGYILGGAILLHDSALTFEAYAGGREGVRKTDTWLDAYELAKRGGKSTEEAETQSDFFAVRQLHAMRAEQLGFEFWVNDENEKFYLIENAELRKHFGKLIGQIAATHHMPVSSLEGYLQKQVNSPASMPRDWRVDPIKIACLLRCADAAHIDERRAPDFLRSLLDRKGVSAAHWKAQNWLCRADVDTSELNQDALLITSSKAFSKADSDAWWVAYDTLRLIDNEIKKSNELLSKRPQHETSPAFHLKRVTGASRPEDAAHYISVEDWLPKEVEVHISDVEKLVGNLGGNQLYHGEHRAVVLREMIQNAYDAVRARRHLDKQYEGKILVEISEAGNTLHIVVQDDGLGMSERVMTGPLLDFGTSFWSSHFVTREFPGLVSKGMSASGKFGIGFYSLFMVSESVDVYSRRWDAARDSVVRLEFPSGLSMRPLLSYVGNGGLDPEISTKVSLRTKEGFGSSDFIVRWNDDHEPDVILSATEYVPRICAGLDCNIYVRLGGDEAPYQAVHTRIFQPEEEERAVAWLRRLSIAQGQETDDAVLRKTARRLRPIGDLNLGYGVAALCPDLKGVGSRTIGGLGTDHGGTGYFFGFVDHEADTASRNYAGKIRAPYETREKWVREQLELIGIEGLCDKQLSNLCHGIVYLGVLPPPTLIRVPLIGEGSEIFISFDAFYETVVENGICIYEDQHSRGRVPFWAVDKPYKDFATIGKSGGGDFYSFAERNEPRFDRDSIFHMLEKRLNSAGLTLKVERVKNVGETPYSRYHANIFRAEPV